MLGRWKEAYSYLDQHYDLLDSLKEEESTRQLNELNKRFELDELRAQQEREKMESERQQMYLLMAIVAIIFIAIVVFILLRLQAARRLAILKTEQERIESELRIARNIQMSMVPSTFPNREGLDMYASMTPAREVGGDLYGYVINGDSLYFCLGDVSGKGVPASLFMAQATRLFQTLAKQGLPPAEICTRMNDALSGEDNGNMMFVTFFLGLIDLNTGHLSFCNAGHNPPIIGGSPTHGEFLQMAANVPLGLWAGFEFVGEEIDCIKGRPLFIYTDGLNEAEDPQQQQFSDERLLSILRNTHFESSQQVVEHLAEEVEKHRNGAEPNDDLTMMCIRVEE
ncbi:MAG: serine/threonine-protein phosphatase [Prevotella sp.]|nr:serine/threonine-protein phosphatase [Prevotella sp.]